MIFVIKAYCGTEYRSIFKRYLSFLYCRHVISHHLLIIDIVIQRISEGDFEIGQFFFKEKKLHIPLKNAYWCRPPILNVVPQLWRCVIYMLSYFVALQSYKSFQLLFGCPVLYLPFFMILSTILIQWLWVPLATKWRALWPRPSTALTLHPRFIRYSAISNRPSSSANRRGVFPDPSIQSMFAPVK